MAALAELTDTISVAADAISTNFELQQQQRFLEGGGQILSEEIAKVLHLIIVRE